MQLPVWIELPFCTLILEKSRQLIAESLGEILYYIQRNELSSYPHDQACILWDTTKEIPMSIRVGIKGYKDLAIWQPVLFRNIPYHCYRCNGKGHLARDCQEFGVQNGPRTREEDGINSAIPNAVESLDLQPDVSRACLIS
jgi:hypothetical protein